MEGFSDDEKYEVEQILGQRKRKGIVEYLVNWKGTEENKNSWEPAKTIAADCALAVQIFLQKQKAEKSRSKSKSRSASRSRSRSNSRSRKAGSKAGKSSRSRSRGRQESKKSTSGTSPKEEIEETSLRRSARQKAAAVSESLQATPEVKVVEEKVETKTTAPASSSFTSSQAMSKVTTEESDDTPRRSLRSSTLEQRKILEVQRVHNDQRPVREDDSKPRSPLWKVADYIVIVMFVVSLCAAIFLFVEKFVDLENFKKQAFPNLSVLRNRLLGVKQHFVDFCYSLGDYISDGWLHFVELVKRPESGQTAKPVPK